MGDTLTINTWYRVKFDYDSVNNKLTYTLDNQDPVIYDYTDAYAIVSSD